MNQENKEKKKLKIILIIIVVLILFLIITVITDLKKPINIIPYGYLTPKKAKSFKIRPNLWPFNTKTGKYLGK